MGGIPMYMCPVYQADVSRDEPAPDKISRLQKTLGGAFNGVRAPGSRGQPRGKGATVPSLIPS
eukprot:2584480-Pyramimonas_sp.AAC.1